MQIDVLSQNTLKLTLSRLDMYDMDIKYESLSGKNPDTKRLLSHVLRTVKLDKSAAVDFSGERLFVEAFPRPDGGCMLYISCLEDAGNGNYIGERKTVRLTAKPTAVKQPRNYSQSSQSEKLLCRFDGIKELDGACKNLSWQQTNGRITLTSTLYSNKNEYRLLISGNNKKLITAIVSEYGQLLTLDHELPLTHEYYSLLVSENAIEKMSTLL